jgi:hypothetical protein
MQKSSSLPSGGQRLPEQLTTPRRAHETTPPAPAHDDQLDGPDYPDDDGRDPYDIEYDH